MRSCTSKMDLGTLVERRENRNHFVYICGIGFVVQLIVMIVIAGILGNIAPEIKTTLTDVNTMMPEMRQSLLDLGQLIPEIKGGMDILNELCKNDVNCNLV